MSITLSETQKEALVKLLNLTDQNKENIFIIIESYLTEPLLPLKPMEQSNTERKIDSSSKSKTEKQSVIDRLKRIEKLSDKLKKEIDLLSQDMKSRISEHLSLMINDKEPNLFDGKHIPLPPDLILSSLSESAKCISDDFGTAYSNKYNKVICDLRDFWEFTLGKEPTLYREGEFIQFLTIVLDIKTETAYQSYRIIKPSG